jgi:hypothetical protein
MMGMVIAVIQKLSNKKCIFDSLYFLFQNSHEFGTLTFIKDFYRYLCCHLLITRGKAGTIYNVDEGDSGLYWCEAINSSGLSRSDDVQLDIFDGNVIGGVVVTVLL